MLTKTTLWGNVNTLKVLQSHRTKAANGSEPTTSN